MEPSRTWTKNNPSLTSAQRNDLGYDNADQLLTAPLKDASTNALIKQYIYGYDLAANRTSEQVANKTTTSMPNNVNEITSQSGGPNRTLTYDLNGSLVNDGSSRTFEWDGANRLVAINYTGTTNRSELSYDGLSRVVKIVEKTGSTINSTNKFVWCGTQRCEIRNANDGVSLRMYGQGQYDSGTAYFYSRDHLGSVREMFKSDDTLIARYDYDPWGRSTATLNTIKPDANFTGLYRHAKSNLDFATYRAYDPDLGRWISRDPIAERGGINLYEYVGNNPISGIDPLGLKTCWKYVIMTHFEDVFGALSDRIPLTTGDIAVGHYGPNQLPGKNDQWVLPPNTKVQVYPTKSPAFEATVRDVGGFDKHPANAGKGIRPDDWIDIWNPTKSRRKISESGWISIEIDDCKKCPEGWLGD